MSERAWPTIEDWLDNAAGANIADALAHGHRGEQLLELYAKDVRETATAVFGEITLPALTLQGIAVAQKGPRDDLGALSARPVTRSSRLRWCDAGRAVGGRGGFVASVERIAYPRFKRLVTTMSRICSSRRDAMRSPWASRPKAA
ncbi:hypothetical protein DMH15_33255 [Streptomyces sp. WAC 06725]|uniref:hypothetical protein n=1 Tax=Streptomyces sp. WAC 06725 TaxID=2203209 RepID=UPI000F749832|nr:hypothetical protein [Streptomyces sp. WAC 06725]RSO22463.1 hypothetical protein DMH15_33255 [Streptomyces sp. WAC 06725]